MSQHDFDIASQTASNARIDINNALKALASLSSGSIAPTTTYANMLWYDTTNNQLKKRNEADSAWTTLGTIDEGTGKFDPNNSYVNIDYTPVQQGGGTGQGTNKVYIGWSAGGQLLLQVDSVNFGSSWPITANPPTTLGAVGTYAWLGWNAQVTFNAGQFVAGSNLVYAGFLSASGYNDNTAADLLGGSSPSGTWQAMGEANSVTNRAPSTLFLRIA